ncbi:hypothetical protein HYFRA_00011086 [Hymenoscyphus fraxineus]|uniref:SGF29 C-terminal domain-containing protein n=1 Tax=Hymenoscyphus fraxineus TaxID=746836 RepID=A0A9N9L2R2_9HELO|nr:hypothetical protein HYFRA_00011086 [Hymenoscyphus fraxineus]
MSSAPGRRRNGGRANADERHAENTIWSSTRESIQGVAQFEKRAKDLTMQIFAQEVRMHEIQAAGKKLPIEEIDVLDVMYREMVEIADDEKAALGTAEDKDSALGKIDLLTTLTKHNEEEEKKEKASVSLSRGSTSRDSHNRAAIDYDGPSDSPGPSPADNRQVRKLGGGGGPARTGSQPPRNLDVIIRTSDSHSETAERSGNKPKIVYAVNDEVAFKRKSGDEHDWIQGVVTRVIGEGKSRRYEVRDPYPDPNTVETTYKSSASQMVPIPVASAHLGDYEPGRRVLALYPQTSTFYRADVRRMVDGGAKVELLFEEEREGEQEKIVARRFVLDHRG